MNQYINTQGFAKIGMLTVVIGAVINVILDPIYFGVKFRCKRSSTCYNYSARFSAIWVLKFLLGKKSILKIRKKFLKLEKKIF